MTVFRFNVWDSASDARPAHVIRHGVCVEIDAETYEAARDVLVREYASGRRNLSLGPVENWKHGDTELVVTALWSERPKMGAS